MTCITHQHVLSCIACIYTLRSGLGVVGRDAHDHGAWILTNGFSYKKCDDVVCFTHNPSDTAAVEFNNTLVDLSGGLIPPLAELRFLSVGGGHTNTFLRALKAGCITHCKDLKDVLGRMNPETLAAGRPQLQTALQEGLMWLIIDHRCMHDQHFHVRMTFSKHEWIL